MEEKKFDINSFIGMILIGGILFWWMSSNQPEFDQNTEINTEKTINSNSTKKQNNLTNLPPVLNDSLKRVEIQNQLGAFASSIINGNEGTTTLENELLLLKISHMIFLLI